MIIQSTEEMPEKEAHGDDVVDEGGEDDEGDDPAPVDRRMAAAGR